MDLGLKGKIALVAGASKGLGLAAAKALGAEGAVLAICSRDEAHLLKAAREMESQGMHVLTIKADVSNPTQACAFVKNSIDKLGSVDILVNNAGGPPPMAFEDIDIDTWGSGFRLNLLSTIVMIKTALPIMKAKRWGRIINMTSVAVKQPIDGLIISNTIRCGVIGLAKTLSKELAPYNITVNNICPGYFLTNRVYRLADSIAKENEAKPEDVIAEWERDIPLKRLGNPEEFGSLVAFLASENASYITGTSVQIDGGFYRGTM
ncbi:MAG: SDR family oxidoreductase [Deltaproteobacteria bacterium]|nr:SDR family oxidoreductase [Deltaproteobacteria bacterium]